MDLVSMEHESGAGEAIPAPGGSEYPYGLRITLTHHELEKLGITALPPAGTGFHIEALATCTESSTSDYDADGDIDHVCLCLQITELACEHDYEPEKKSKSESLYGKK